MGFLHRHRWLTPYLLLAPGLVWLTVFFLVPLGTLAYQSLQEGSFDFGYTFGWEWQNYADAIRTYEGHLVRSFVFAGLATVLALAISYPLAYFIAIRGGRWKNALLFLVILPFFVSFLIRTLSWKLILADGGFILGTLKDFGLVSQDFRILATPAAVISGLVYNFLPFMALPLYASLEKLDRSLLEAAGDLYSSPLTGFRKVTFPLSLPGVVSGTLLTFIPACGDYINAEFLGTPRQYMVGNRIQAAFLTEHNYPLAASLSIILMAVVVAMVVLYVRRAGTEELV